VDRGVVMNPFRRLRRAVVGDKRQRLITDIDRAATYMSMILHEARTLGAPDTIDAATSLLFWRMWLIKVRDWAEESES
jgi:hypothetical protein